MPFSEGWRSWDGSIIYILKLMFIWHICCIDYYYVFFCFLSITTQHAHIGDWPNEMVPWYTDCFVTVFIDFLRLMLKGIVNAVCRWCYVYFCCGRQRISLHLPEVLAVSGEKTDFSQLKLDDFASKDLLNLAFIRDQTHEIWTRSTPITIRAN